jgi:hypothetical protein
MGAFDVHEATRAAAEAVEAVAAERGRQLREEAEQAKVVAAEYAQHLADGGDPWKTPAGTNRYSRNRSAIVNDLTGIVAVYRVWNLARGSMNPIVPIQNVTQWRVAERLLEQVPEPVLYGELSQLKGGVSSSRVTSEDVQRAMRAVERGTDGALVPRRTKIGGKVAFYFRPRRYDDEPFDADRHGYGGDVPEESLATA